MSVSGTSDSKSVALRVPDVGFDTLPVTVGIWLVETGQKFEVGERLVELQSPGLLHSVIAETAGVLTRITARTGKGVSCGEELCLYLPLAVD